MIDKDVHRPSSSENDRMLDRAGAHTRLPAWAGLRPGPRVKGATGPLFFRSGLSRAASAMARLDPRTKMVAFICLCVGAFVAEGYGRLLVLLALAAVWAAAGGASAGRKQGALLKKSACMTVLILLLLSSAPRQLAAVGEFLLRFQILLLAGCAFSQSITPGQLVSALQKLRCPKPIVLIIVAAESMFAILSSEVRWAYDAARIRSAATVGRRSPKTLARDVWRTAVSFCSRLFLKADEMAAAVESRGFSRPGARSSLQALRLRALDVVSIAACCIAALLCVVP